jgi:signal recognition particle GTPase
MALSQPIETQEAGTVASVLPAPMPRETGPAPREWPTDITSLLGEVLRSHGLPETLVDRLVDLAAAPIHTKRPVDRLAVALGAYFHFLPLEDALAEPMLLHGATGAGVSTVAAKLAARFDEHQVLVVSAGARSAAGNETLEDYLEVLGLPLVAAPDAKSLDSIIASAAGRKMVIDSGSASADAVAGTQGMLVLSAETGATEAVAAAQAAAAHGTRRMIVTRFDTARYLGAALVAADAGKLALVAASVTPHFAFGLRALSPENLARRLMSAAASNERWRTATL